MLKIKDNVSLEILRNYGFKTGKEWADSGERCLVGTGYEYLHNRWFKFRMDIDEETGELTDRIMYTNEEYDIPMVEISVIPETRSIYLDLAPSCTYHIDGDELDVATDTLFQLISDGLVEMENRDE